MPLNENSQQFLLGENTFSKVSWEPISLDYYD